MAVDKCDAPDAQNDHLVDYEAYEAENDSYARARAAKQQAGAADKAAASEAFLLNLLKELEGGNAAKPPAQAQATSPAMGAAGPSRARPPQAPTRNTSTRAMDPPAGFMQDAVPISLAARTMRPPASSSHIPPNPSTRAMDPPAGFAAHSARNTFTRAIDPPPSFAPRSGAASSASAFVSSSARAAGPPSLAERLGAFVPKASSQQQQQRTLATSPLAREVFPEESFSAPRSTPTSRPTTPIFQSTARPPTPIFVSFNDPMSVTLDLWPEDPHDAEMDLQDTDAYPNDEMIVDDQGYQQEQQPTWTFSPAPEVPQTTETPRHHPKTSWTPSGGVHAQRHSPNPFAWTSPAPQPPEASPKPFQEQYTTYPQAHPQGYPSNPVPTQEFPYINAFAFGVESQNLSTGTSCPPAPINIPTQQEPVFACVPYQLDPLEACMARKARYDGPQGTPEPSLAQLLNDAAAAKVESDRKFGKTRKTMDEVLHVFRDTPAPAPAPFLPRSIFPPPPTRLTGRTLPATEEWVPVPEVKQSNKRKFEEDEDDGCPIPGAWSRSVKQKENLPDIDTPQADTTNRTPEIQHSDSEFESKYILERPRKRVRFRMPSLPWTEERELLRLASLIAAGKLVKKDVNARLWRAMERLQYAVEDAVERSEEEKLAQERAARRAAKRAAKKKKLGFWASWAESAKRFILG